MSTTVHKDIGSISGPWADMERLPSVSVHQTTAWCRAWKEATNAQTLVVEHVQGGSRIILPLEIASGGLGRIARPLGTRFSNLNTAVAHIERGFDPEEFLNSVLQELADYVDLLQFDKTALFWGGQDNVLLGLSRVPSVNSSFQLELADDMSSTIAQLDAAKRMKVFRASWRKFDAAGGWHYEEITDPLSASVVLNQFFAQKEARFRAAGLPNVFADPSTKSFFNRLVTSPGTDGGHILRLHVLRLKGPAGQPIAIAGISTKGAYAISQFGSVDESAVPGASPGEFLYHLIVERLCKAGFRIFDFGIGDLPHKRRWCNVETHQFDMVMPIRATGNAAMQVSRAATSLKRFVKERPVLYRALQRLRSKLPLR